MALYGQSPTILRLVRLRDGWHRRGRSANRPEVAPPVPWAGAGRCWAGSDHAVVDATDLVAGAEERPHVTVTATQPPGRRNARPAPPVTAAPPSPDGAVAARRDSGG